MPLCLILKGKPFTKFIKMLKRVKQLKQVIMSERSIAIYITRAIVTPIWNFAEKSLTWSFHG